MAAKSAFGQSGVEEMRDWLCTVTARALSRNPKTPFIQLPMGRADVLIAMLAYVERDWEEPLEKARMQDERAGGRA